jgi:hypothetical protein
VRQKYTGSSWTSAASAGKQASRRELLFLTEGRGKVPEGGAQARFEGKARASEFRKLKTQNGLLQKLSWVTGHLEQRPRAADKLGSPSVRLMRIPIMTGDTMTWPRNRSYFQWYFIFSLKSL